MNSRGAYLPAARLPFALLLAMIRKHTGNTSAAPIRQVMGTAKILEYALGAHPAAACHRDVIVESIDYRREAVFHAAFARGSFDMAAEMLSMLENKRPNLKFMLKVWIMSLPVSLRHSSLAPDAALVHTRVDEGLAEDNRSKIIEELLTLSTLAAPAVNNKVWLGLA